MKKVLIIRFSSFGDIVQSLISANALKRQYDGNIEVHFLTKSEFSSLVSLSPDVDKVHSFDKRNGLLGLFKFYAELSQYKFGIVYDAHKNIRTLFSRFFFIKSQFIVRSKERFNRWLYFTFRKNNFENWPYKGAYSYVLPLIKAGLISDYSVDFQSWKFEELIEKSRREELKKYSNKVCLIPSAAWKLKVWPFEYWKVVVQSSHEFVVLGGPSDEICFELEKASKGNLTNLAGKLSLIESCYVLSLARYFISNDTGLLHVGDALGVRGTAVIGPTAFGYPTYNRVDVLETSLSCKPCTKDGNTVCKNKIYKKCLFDVTPERVLKKLSQ